MTATLPRRLLADRGGVAAVEFALVLPLMLIVYVGTCAVTSAVSASRSTTLLSRTVTDLVSQQQANTPLTDTSLRAMLAAAATVMAPFPLAALKVTVSNVEFVADPAATATNSLDARTRWTVTFTGGNLRPCTDPHLTAAGNTDGPSPTSLPVGLYKAGFLIVADVSYTYTPSFGFFTYDAGSGQASGSPLTFSMGRTSYMRPRQTDNIRYAPGQTASICPLVAAQGA